MPFTFTGIDPLYKNPKFIAKIVWSAGAISAASLPLYVLYVGMKTSAGSMTADQDVVEVTSEEQINSLAGARSELAWMARMGMKAAPTVRHFMAAVAEPSGGTAATATITLGGSWSTPGSYELKIAGISIRGNIASTDTPDTVLADIASRLGSNATVPVTAGAVDTLNHRLTLTVANKGATGKDWTLFFDTKEVPSGFTVTLAGSATLSQNRVKFGASSTGTGYPDVTTILTQLQTTRYARIAPAQNDATNAALWETHVRTMEGFDKLLLEQLVFAVSGSQSNATTLGQTTLNCQRAQVLWMRNADIHPAVIAAVKAAIRASREGTEPVPDYDALQLPNIPPHLYAGDNMLDSEVNAALNAGVTPVVSAPDGTARVVRSITSYCLTDTAMQDERTLDIGDAVMTDYATLDLKLAYDTEFRPANKYVGPNPSANETEPPPGVAYPDLWTTLCLTKLQGYYKEGWVEDPTANPPVSQYNAQARAIESLMPLVVRRVQHQLRQIVRQTAP